MKYCLKTWIEANSRIHTTNPHEAEGLSREDYEELISLVNEPQKKIPFLTMN
jgi:hypothetical protein